jgi:hypothetical protein
LSKQDIVERLLRARLATRICGIYHPSSFESLELWQLVERDELCQTIDLILDLDKSDADEQVAEIQYKLLQHIEITYSQKLIPKWHSLIDQACWRNWYLAITRSLGPMDLWGEVMCRDISSALTTTILRSGPGDKEFATYLLDEWCRRKSYMEADNRSVQVLLSAGANPNATDVLCSRDGSQHSLWHQFVLGFMEIEQGNLAESDYRAVQARKMATVKCFLRHGADLLQQLVVVRSSDTTDCADTIEGIGRYTGDFAGYLFLDSGNTISAVNGAYLLRQLSLKFPCAYREGNLAEFTTSRNLPPLCRDLAIVGRMGTLYRLPPDGPDLWVDIIRSCEENSESSENSESLVLRLEMKYPQLFLRHRRVQMRTLLREQVFEPGQETQFEHGESWIDRMKWTCRHLKARQALRSLNPYYDRGML